VAKWFVLMAFRLMNTVSLVGSVSRRAGGLFESVRRLHQELRQNAETLKGRNLEMEEAPGIAIGVNVFGLRDEFTEQDFGAWHPVPVHPFRIRGPRAFGYAPGLCRMLTNANPDLVHVHGLWQYNSLATVRWHRKSHKPYIVSPHGMLDPWALKNSAWKKRVAWIAYELRHLKEAGCIRALCRSEADSIRALGLRNPICIIPNGVDLPLQAEEKPQAKRSNPEGKWPPSAGKILLYLGRIHPKKGLTLLLRAWAETPRPHDWVLTIVGWDQAGHEGELKHLAGELGMSWADAYGRQQAGTTVFFVGPQFGASKCEWLRRCDAVILPSFSEGVPMAILEGWAYAKPALITPQCHLPEGVTAGAAIPIEPNLDAIVAGLHRLFRGDRAALERMGACGRELVERTFSWPKISADLKGVYHWLRDRGPKPECVLSC
jgi:poly(glycerol-phosphate) alpha-glucosyltransferase